MRILNLRVNELKSVEVFGLRLIVSNNSYKTKVNSYFKKKRPLVLNVFEFSGI